MGIKAQRTSAQLPGAKETHRLALDRLAHHSSLLITALSLSLSNSFFLFNRERERIEVLSREKEVCSLPVNLKASSNGQTHLPSLIHFFFKMKELRLKKKWMMEDGRVC